MRSLGMLTCGSVSFTTTLSLVGSDRCKEGVYLKLRSTSSIFGWRWRARC